MAMSPRNILMKLGWNICDDPQVATEKEIRRAFLNAGYGLAKANKWIETYRREDILRIVDSKDGERIYSCIWWQRCAF